jgi:hypothetical protein
MIRAFIVSKEAAEVDHRERLWLKERLEHGHVLGGKPRDWVQFLKTLPADERLLWREVILQQVKYFTVGIDEISSFDDERLVDATTQIIPAIVAIGKAERSRLEQGARPTYPMSLKNVEFVPANELRTSESARTSSTGFRRGTQRQMTWDTLFHPVLSLASSAVVVDRYLFESFTREPRKRPNEFSESGAHWFLDQTARLKGGAGIPLQIYTSFDDSLSTAEVEDVMGRLLPQFPSISISIAACRRSIFRKLIHRRYLRVIANGKSRSMIQIDPGLDGLDAARNGCLVRDIDFMNRTQASGDESEHTTSSCRSDESRVMRAVLQSGVVLRSDSISPSDLQ